MKLSQVGNFEETLQSQAECLADQALVRGWCCRGSSTTPCPSPPSAPPPSPSWCSWQKRGVCFHSLSAPDAAQHSALRSSSKKIPRYILKVSVLQTFYKSMFSYERHKQDSTSTSTGKGFILRGRHKSFIWRDKNSRRRGTDTETRHKSFIGGKNAFEPPAPPSASSFPAMWNLHSHRSRIQVNCILYIYHPYTGGYTLPNLLCVSLRALEYFRHIGDNGTNSIR